jgi:hypothetical protein
MEAELDRREHAAQVGLRDDRAEPGRSAHARVQN